MMSEVIETIIYFFIFTIKKKLVKMIANSLIVVFKLLCYKSRVYYKNTDLGP